MKLKKVFMLTQWKYNNKKGIFLIEILIVIAIITITLASLLGLATFSLMTSNLLKETNQAQNFAQEAAEAVRNFRDGTSWNTDGLGTLDTTGTTYYPKKTIDNPPKWQLVQGVEIINGFTRKVIFDSVQRDTNDNIVGSGGVNDPDTRKVTITVSWKNKKVEIITYLTNWKK